MSQNSYSQTTVAKFRSNWTGYKLKTFTMTTDVFIKGCTPVFKTFIHFIANFCQIKMSRLSIMIKLVLSVQKIHNLTFQNFRWISQQ